jgi:hypothetical protein
MTDHKSQILTDYESQILRWGITLSVCLLLIAAAVSH